MKNPVTDSGYTGYIARFCKVDNRKPRFLNRNQLLQQFRNRGRRNINSYADAAKTQKHEGKRRPWNRHNVSQPTNSYHFSEEEMNEWRDEEEYSSEGNDLNKGTRAGGSMHDNVTNKGKQVQVENLPKKSRDLAEVKNQLENLTKMLGDFKKENDEVKKEILAIKNQMNENKKTGKPQPAPRSNVNNNNKRVKADTSSSENEKNDLILTLESKVEKQDTVLNEMFAMVSNITQQLSKNDNQNISTNSRTSNNGGIGRSVNFSYNTKF